MNLNREEGIGSGVHGRKGGGVGLSAVTENIPQRSRCPGIGIVAIIIAMAAFTTCGLEVGVFFFPPAEDSITSFPLPPRGQINDLPTAVFINNPSNNLAGFLGYEIYYRFYDHGVAEERFHDDRVALRETGFPRPDIALTNRGYRRIANPTSSQPPLIRIAPEIAFAEQPFQRMVPIEVGLFPAGEPSSPFGEPFDAFVRWPQNVSQSEFNVIRLRRVIGSGELRPFLPLVIDPTNNYSSAHSDVSSITEFESILGTPNFAIAIFVFGYGFNPSNPAVAVYSEPVGLMYASMVQP